jgi:hypothetical protein
MPQLEGGVEVQRVVGSFAIAGGDLALLGPRASGELIF